MSARCGVSSHVLSGLLSYCYVRMVLSCIVIIPFGVEEAACFAFRGLCHVRCSGATKEGKIRKKGKLNVTYKTTDPQTKWNLETKCLGAYAKYGIQIILLILIFYPGCVCGGGGGGEGVGGGVCAP